MGKLVDKGTCMYSKWILSLKILGVKLVCGPIILSDSYTSIYLTHSVGMHGLV